MHFEKYFEWVKDLPNLYFIKFHRMRGRFDLLRLIPCKLCVCVLSCVQTLQPHGL